MFLSSGAQELVHNTDIQGQLTKLVEGPRFRVDRDGSDRLAEVERGMRRNLLRSLRWMRWELALEKAEEQSSDARAVQNAPNGNIFKMAKTMRA